MAGAIVAVVSFLGVGTIVAQLVGPGVDKFVGSIDELLVGASVAVMLGSIGVGVVPAAAIGASVGSDRELFGAKLGAAEVDGLKVVAESNRSVFGQLKPSLGVPIASDGAVQTREGANSVHARWFLTSIPAFQQVASTSTGNSSSNRPLPSFEEKKTRKPASPAYAKAAPKVVLLAGG